MKRPDPVTVAQLANIQRQYRDVLTYLEDWYKDELTKLPYASMNTAVSQGRCQVLKELTELISKAPELAADPMWQQRPTHTDRSVTNGTS